MRIILMGSAGLAVVAGMAVPRVASGQPAGSPPPPTAFKACAACHSVQPGAAAGMGPNLRGIFRARAGSKPGYQYSNALKSSAIVWTRSNLDAYLADPMKRVPGTTMAVRTPDSAARKAIIDYIAALD